MKKFVFMLIALSILQSSTCHKQSCETTYEFNIPFSITELDSFRIGDTIWLSSTINPQLQDRITKSNINVSAFDFKIFCGLYRRDTTVFDQAEKYFNFINSIGRFDSKISSTTVQTSVIYDNKNGLKSIKIGLVPKKTGIFSIGFFNLVDDYTNVKLTQSECVESIKGLYNMNEGRDFNYYLIQKSPQEISTEEEYKKDGTYVFKVIK